MLTELYIPLFSVDNVNQVLMHFNFSIEGVRVDVLQPDRYEPILMLSRCSISLGKTEGRAIFYFISLRLEHHGLRNSLRWLRKAGEKPAIV